MVLLPGDQEVDALRHRAADALQLGLQFVSRYGRELAILRTRTLLGADSLEQCVAAVAALQRSDGGFEPVGLARGGALGLAEGARTAALAPEVAAALEALVALSDLAIWDTPCLGPAADFLQVAQGPDGSWGDSETPAPGRIFVTGMLAGLLGRTRVVRPVVLERAAGFLEKLWSPERISGQAWPELTAFAVFFSGVDHDEADGALQWIGRELERGYRQRIYDAGATLRTLLHCQALAVPGASLDPFALLTDLLNEQGADGGFAEFAPGDDSLRVEPTLDAMHGILRLCSVLSGSSRGKVPND